MKRVPTVEVHSWSREKYEITEWIRDLRVSGATHEPWSQIRAVLRLPAALWTQKAPRQGDWLVVRDGDRKAIGWGYVATRSGGLSVKGSSVVTKDTQVATIDWLDLLGRVEIYVAPGLKVVGGLRGFGRARKWSHKGVLPGEPGTLLPIQRWTDPDTGPWQALIKAARNYFVDEAGKQVHRPIGFALQEFLKVIVRVLVPASLSREYLAAQLRTVYDETGVAAYAPDRAAEPVPGYTISGLTALQPQGTNVLGLLMQTFMPDMNMVECFSSLEGPGVLESSNDPVDRRLRDGPGASEIWVPEYDINSPPPLAPTGLQESSVSEMVRLREEEEANRTDEERYGRKLAAGLGENLGRNPVLVYRMKPWRASTLGQFIEQAPASASQVILLKEKKGLTEEIVVAEDPTFGKKRQVKLDPAHFNLDMFVGTTWRYDEAPEVDSSAVIDVSFGVDDMDHANTVTIGLPTQADSPIRFMQRLGLPFYSDQAILARGVRLFQPQWPFFPPIDPRDKAKGEPSSSSDMLRDMRTIALLGAQFMTGADRFETGSVFLDYSPQVRHGEPIKLSLPRNTPGQSKHLVAYVERWEHRWQVSDTSVKARTLVEFSRGLFDEEVRSEPFIWGGPGGVR